MDGPYFAGSEFSLVDAIFGPRFRYFDVFEQVEDFGIFADKPKVKAWRVAIAARPSVKRAVAADYQQRLLAFLAARPSYLAGVMKA